MRSAVPQPMVNRPKMVKTAKIYDKNAGAVFEGTRIAVLPPVT